MSLRVSCKQVAVPLVHLDPLAFRPRSQLPIPRHQRIESAKDFPWGIFYVRVHSSFVRLPARDLYSPNPSSQNESLQNAYPGCSID